MLVLQTLLGQNELIFLYGASEKNQDVSDYHVFIYVCSSNPN